MNKIPSMIAPQPGTLHYHPYVVARQFHEIDEARLISVGGVLEQAQISLPPSHTIDPADFVEKYTEQFEPHVLQYAEDQIQIMETSPITIQATLRRTELLHSLSRQLVLLPELFKNRTQESVEERKKLIGEDGVYGLIGDVLTDSNTDFHTHQANGKDLTDDIGLITELTALAVLNRPQTPSFVALPGLPAEDRKFKDDLNVLISGKFLSVRHYQVKTDESHLIKHRTGNQLYIGGIALGNGNIAPQWDDGCAIHATRRTAAAVIDELNGTSTERQQSVLLAISSGIRAASKDGRSFIGYQDLLSANR